MYGRYLLNEGRYAEAYPYLEAAARGEDAESRHALRTCAALWAAELMADAKANLVAGKNVRTLPLLLKARDLDRTVEAVDLVREVDATLRAIDDGRESLELLRRQERWSEAMALAVELLRLAPHEGEFYARWREARERYRAEVEHRAAEYLEAGMSAEAAATLEDGDKLLALAALPSCENPEYVPRVSFPHRYRKSLPWLDGEAAGADGGDASLRETVVRAVDTDRALAAFRDAISAERLSDAANALAAAEHVAPQAADYSPRLRQAGSRLDAAAARTLDTAFLSGDLRRALTLFRDARQIPIAAETRALSEEKIRNLLAQRLKQCLADNMTANALLLLGSARAVFPDLWPDVERKARFAFQASMPVIVVKGEGADEMRAWLKDAHLPLGDGRPLLLVEAEKPELIFQEAPTSLGVEAKEVPTDLTRYPHPEREGLLAELARLHAAAAVPPESDDPWEVEHRRRTAAFWHGRYLQLEDQLDRLPAHSYRFEWQMTHVNIVYHQLHAEYDVKLAFSPPSAPGASAPETVTVRRSYTAKAPPGIDPYTRGYFPPKDTIKTELGNLLVHKVQAMARTRFDAALGDVVKEAVTRAGEGDGDGAVEMLARVYVTRGEGLAAFREAEALLTHAWGRSQTATLLVAPSDGLAEKPVK